MSSFTEIVRGTAWAIDVSQSRKNGEDVECRTTHFELREWRTRVGVKCLVGEFVERVLVCIRLEY